MCFEKYIGKDVIVKRDGSDNRLNGRLVRIIPREIGDNGETLVVDCSGTEKIIPVVDLQQFFLCDDLADENIEYFYVVFRYGKTERSKEHIYMSYDTTIKPGDKVLVWKGWAYVGNVIRTGFFKRAEAPYPVEKTWLIQQKLYDKIDFMKYDDSNTVIRKDNLYKDHCLNEENSYTQFVAKVDYQYQWEADNNIEDLENEKWKPKQTDPDTMKKYVTGRVAEYGAPYWTQTNQMDIFYTSLWMCSYIARHNGYDQYLFDRYICLSQIYKHGDFDEFLLAPAYDRPNIERAIGFIDEYIAKSF